MVSLPVSTRGPEIKRSAHTSHSGLATERFKIDLCLESLALDLLFLHLFRGKGELQNAL